MYALSQSLLLTHYLLKSLVSKLVISLNNITKCSKNSEYSIAFGGIAKLSLYIRPTFLITWKIKYDLVRILECVMRWDEMHEMFLLLETKNNKFVTSVYRKPKFSGVFTNFESYIAEMHKPGLIETLLHRSFRLCSSYENFHQEIETLKLIFKHKHYPQNFLNWCIKKSLNKLFIKKDFQFHGS